jgi:peptidoglycan/LPS O-acetylase OafA/YrhL
MVSGILDGFHHTLDGPAWSISVEFFCYLILFPLLVCLNRLLFKNKLGVMVSVLLVGLFTFCLYRCGSGDLEIPLKISHWEWNCSWLGRGIFGFCAGFFLCSIFRKSLIRPPSLLAINLMFFVAVGIFFLTRIGILPDYLILFLFPFLVFFTAYDLGFGATILKVKPLQWLGERSYSIYLWHMPLLIFQIFLFSLTGKIMPTGPWDCAILVALVLVISEISYRYFETPCRDYIRSLGRKSLIAA